MKEYTPKANEIGYKVNHGDGFYNSEYIPMYYFDGNPSKKLIFNVGIKAVQKHFVDNWANGYCNSAKYYLTHSLKTTKVEGNQIIIEMWDCDRGLQIIITL